MTPIQRTLFSPSAAQPVPSGITPPLITDFQTNPLPLPVWIWNCLVIYISIRMAWFLIQIGVIILAGLAFFLSGIFG